MKFRKRPVVVEAVRWIGRFKYEEAGAAGMVSPYEMLRLGLGLSIVTGMPGDMPDWLVEARQAGVADVSVETVGGLEHQVGLRLRTSGGWHEVAAGDWVVKGAHGELYSVKSEMFAEGYEDVSVDPVDPVPGMDADLYFALRENDGFNCKRSVTMSLAEARVRARDDVEQHGARIAVVCREIAIYRRRYISEEIAPAPLDRTARSVGEITRRG